MNNPDIYSYIKSEETNFESDEVRLGDNWNWNFRNHVQLIFHLKNSIFYTGENNWLRAFKQVMRPLLRLSYWTEDIEVKDIVFFIETAKGRALSFLIKKYHDEIYVKEHDVDTMIDEITESDIDYGGALAQRSNMGRPEVLQLNAVAFCDQTEALGGPIAFKHHFSPDGLRRMAKVGWGEESNGATISLDELITMADHEKEPDGMHDVKTNKVTGKTIEVYVLRGNLPEHYLKDNDNNEDTYNQIHIVAFYTDSKKKRQGVTLYRKKEDEGNIKFHASEKVHGRALGYGDGESFLHPQIWTNFLTIHKTNLLESASKVPLFTDDPAYTQRNKIQDMENLEVTTVDSESRFGIQQVPTAAPANLQLISGAVEDWFEHSQLLGAAFDPILGKEAVSGTTFRGQERTVAQGRGWHDRRRGQRAKFIEEIYRDWIIPDIVKEITRGKAFLTSLTVEELSWIADRLATNYANREMAQRMLESVRDSKKPLPTREERDQVLQTFKENFSRKGDKHLVEVLKDEFKGIEVKMGINIANKQKDLVNLSDKLLSIFQFVFANPAGFQQAMQIPALAKSFADILEYSGLNQTDFLSLIQPPAQPPTIQEEVQEQQPVELGRQPVENG